MRRLFALPEAFAEGKSRYKRRPNRHRVRILFDLFDSLNLKRLREKNT